MHHECAAGLTPQIVQQARKIERLAVSNEPLNLPRLRDETAELQVLLAEAARLAFDPRRSAVPEAEPVTA